MPDFLKKLFGVLLGAGGGGGVQFLDAILRLILGGVGAGMDENTRKWLEGMIATAIARGDEARYYGRDILTQALPHLSTLGGYAPMLFDEAGAMARQHPALAYYYLANTDQNLRDFLNMSTPHLDTAMGGFHALAPQMGNLADLAYQGFAGGGWTPFFQQAYDLGFGAANNPLVALVGQAGAGLLGGMGETPFTQAAQNEAIRILSTSGSALQPANLAALRILASGGATPATSALENIALATLAQNPLLPLSTAVGLARELAAMGAAGSVRRAMEAAGRLGGPGAVSAGIKAAPLMEAADTISQAVANAGLQALAGQQQLQSAIWGKAGDLAQTALSEAARRLGLAFGFLPSSQSSMASLINAAANLGQAGIMGALERLKTGGNLATAPASIQLQAINALSPVMSAQTRYALGLGELSSRSMENLANLYNAIYQNELRRVGLGLEGFNRYYDALTQMLGQYGTGASNFSRYGLEWALAPLNSLIGIGGNIYTSGLEAATAPARGAAGAVAGVGGWPAFLGSFYGRKG